MNSTFEFEFAKPHVMRIYMARGMFLFLACLSLHLVNPSWLSRQWSKFEIKRALRLADMADFIYRYLKFEAYGYKIFHIWVTHSSLWTSWQKKTHSDFLASCSSDFERGLLLGGWQPWLLKYRLTLVRYLPNSVSGKKGKEPPSTSVRQN